MDTNIDRKWPKIAIIVLNWNKWQDTIECLESVYQITYPNYEVILVDNGSEDESIQKIEEYCEGTITVTSGFFNYEPKNKPIKIIDNFKKKIYVPVYLLMGENAYHIDKITHFVQENFFEDEGVKEFNMDVS